MLGKTERRMAVVVLVTALLPLASAMLLAYSMLGRAAAVGVQPEVEQQLERGIDLYKDYVGSVKQGMKHETEAIAGDEALRDAARRHDVRAADQALGVLFPRYEGVVSLAVEEGDGQILASRNRGKPIDDAEERKLEVRRNLGDGTSPASPERGRDLRPAASPVLVATFAFDRRFERELERAGAIHDSYAQLEKERARLYAPYLDAFAALLGITVVATAVLGFYIARGTTKRISQLAGAIVEVAAGNLDVRAPVSGSDELTELARVFNRMLSEMQQSRARIEYLQRIGAWQEMAQRLAHEIKNPLTPIQLAVQECHRKYTGDEPKFRALLDTTLEIVEEEVGTLRRLVGNFSSFARLPHVELRNASLKDFLRECSEQLGHLGVGAGLSDDSADDVAQQGAAAAPQPTDVEVRWELPIEAMPVAIDRQMLRRVVVNLVRNSVEAVRGAKPAQATAAGANGQPGHVLVYAERVNGSGGFSLVVEDDGPGVAEEMRERVFEPYFTTKAEGTGLGLAIVKKIVVEHDGAISVRRGTRLSGAAFVVELPLDAGSAIVGPTP
jgi:nitrogen fixation/metabolism regulation signal transduction histidine kinase